MRTDEVKKNEVFKLSIKIIACSLGCLMFLYSCTIYRSTPVSIDEAVRSGDKVMVMTSYDKEIRFKYIIEEDGDYFGIKKLKGELVKNPINPDRTQTIRPINKTMSLLANIGGPLILIGGILVADFSPTKRSYPPPFIN